MMAAASIAKALAARKCQKRRNGVRKMESKKWDWAAALWTALDQGAGGDAKTSLGQSPSLIPLTTWCKHLKRNVLHLRWDEAIVCPL